MDPNLVPLHPTAYPGKEEHRSIAYLDDATGKWHLPPREPDTTCNFRRHRRGHHIGYCQKPAGHGVAHRDTGRCKRHSASGQPIKHGRYSKMLEPLRERMEYYLSEEGRQESYSLDVLLARINAVNDYIASSDREDFDVHAAVRALTETGRVIQRHLQHQLDGSIKLDLWRTLTTQKIDIILLAVRKLLRQRGMRAAEADAFIEEVLPLAAKIERTAKK